MILHFAIDQAEVPPQGRTTLEAWLTRIKQLGRSAVVSVAGHADATGPTRHNQQLSMARAEAVAKLIREQGVTVRSVKGFGSRRPLDTNRTSQGRGRNRRVDLRLQPEDMARGVVESHPVIPRRGSYAKPSTSKKRSAR